MATRSPALLACSAACAHTLIARVRFPSGSPRYRSNPNTITSGHPNRTAISMVRGSTSSNSCRSRASSSAAPLKIPGETAVTRTPPLSAPSTAATSSWVNAGKRPRLPSRSSKRARPQDVPASSASESDRAISSVTAPMWSVRRGMVPFRLAMSA